MCNIFYLLFLQFVSSRQREIIVYLFKDKKDKNPDIRYADMIQEISDFTGIGRKTVVSTISQYKKNGTISSPNRKRTRTSLFDKIDELHRHGLRQKVHSFWLQRELPTVDKILIAVNEDPVLPNFKRTTLYRIIKQLDFEFVKRKRCSVLTEKDELIACRRNYTKNIRKYRNEGRSIYYLDVNWMNFGDLIETVRLIVLHIGSEKGFLPGGLLCFESQKNCPDHHDEMDSNHFLIWFKKIIPSLDPNSVIVLDTASYNSTKRENLPTNSWMKTSVLEWLNLNGVTVDSPMLKAELLSIAHETKPKYSSYVIDIMARDAGHTVLRLPPYHSEFNPIDLAWAMVKGYIKQNREQNSSSAYEIDDLHKLLLTAIERVTENDWQHFIEQVIEEENKIWKVDDIMDEIIDSMEPCNEPAIKADISLELTDEDDPVTN